MVHLQINNFYAYIYIILIIKEKAANVKGLGQDDEWERELRSGKIVRIIYMKKI